MASGGRSSFPAYPAARGRRPRAIVSRETFRSVAGSPIGPSRPPAHVSRETGVHRSSPAPHQVRPAHESRVYWTTSRERTFGCAKTPFFAVGRHDISSLRGIRLQCVSVQRGAGRFGPGDRDCKSEGWRGQDHHGDQPRCLAGDRGAKHARHRLRPAGQRDIRVRTAQGRRRPQRLRLPRKRTTASGRRAAGSPLPMSVRGVREPGPHRCRGGADRSVGSPAHPRPEDRGAAG